MKANRISTVRMALAIVTVTLTLTTGLARADSAAPVAAATAISKVPYVITKPGVYLVKKDLVLASATGMAIAVNASDVTLDLGGHVLSTSAPRDGSNTSTGILMDTSVRNVTLRNGTLRNFSTGADLSNASNEGRVLVEKMMVEKCGPTGIGATALSVEIRDCAILDNDFPTGTVTYGILAQGNSIKVVGNQISDLSATVSATGIYIASTGASLAENNAVSTTTAGTFGISVAAGGIGANNIVENTVTNFATGIKFFGSGKYRANLTKACTTPFTGGTAIGADNN